MTNFPISLANIHSDYQTDQETSATFTLENGNKLQLSFYDSVIFIPFLFRKWKNNYA